MIITNVAWPALFLEQGLLSFWPIVLGLLVEWPFVRWATKTKWLTSFYITCIINLVSALIGIVAIPIVGLFITIPHEWLAQIVKMGSSFDPFGWILAYERIPLFLTIDFCAFLASFTHPFSAMCSHIVLKRVREICSKMHQPRFLRITGYVHLAAVFVTTCIEVAAFRKCFSERFFKNKKLAVPSLERVWMGMGLANLLSVALAFCFINCSLR